MISFASSIWLWTMAGIIIPLLIHLWNVRKGKRLKVGSILFFTETAVSRARSLYLTELLLLLIRCLIFILLAMFIAQPILSSAFSSNREGWLLMEKGTIHAAYGKYGKEIDSMLDRGAELHELGGNFEKMSLSDSTAVEKEEVPYWELLKQLENKVPAGLPVRIYTENRLSRFEGTRPVLNLNLDWKTVHIDQQSTWIEQAYEGFNDSIIVTIGKSNPGGTSFNKIVLSKSDDMIKPDPMSVHYENDNMLVDTNTLNISIYADAGTKDGAYLASAIQAAKDFSKRKIRVVVIKDSIQLDSTDWLFWLSDRKVPVKKVAKNIFLYSGGKNYSVATNFSIGNVQIPVNRIFNDTAGNAVTSIWQTGYDQPMLSLLPTARTFIFYSRLDPKWNGLVWSEQFAGFVIDLLYPVHHNKGRENRLVDDQQLLPTEKPNKRSTAATINRPIDHWFWLIAFVLFLVERMLSYRKQKLSNG